MSKYHCKNSCNKCAGDNMVHIIDTDDGYISECETTCRRCGYKDYWAHGYFESGAEIESRCKKYTRETIAVCNE